MTLTAQVPGLQGDASTTRISFGRFVPNAPESVMQAADSI